MTPALKAMVKAMIEEVSRQVYTDYTTEDASPEPFLNDLLVDGSLDLEKVARAGLEAIREPDETIRAGAAAADAAADPFIGTEHEGVPADPADAADHWRFMIDAILGEKR